MVSRYQDLYADDLDKFVRRLEELIPGEYTVDNTYITITPQAETILALTFELV